MVLYLTVHTEESDFQQLEVIVEENKAVIQFFARNDDVTLEYDDRVSLIYTSSLPGLIPQLEIAGEFIRDVVTVQIIDNDRKSHDVHSICCMKLWHTRMHTYNVMQSECPNITQS